MQPLQFLERHFGSYTQNKNEALFHCPFCHHHKPKLSVNMDSFFWKCWVCDEKGRTLFSLVWKHGDRKVAAAYKATFPRHIQPKVSEQTEEFVLELPDEYVPFCNDFKSFHAKRALNYLKRRKIGAAQIIRHKIGYASEGCFQNRIILPSFDSDGHLNFFTGRSFTNDFCKYINPDTPPGYKKTVVFNELNVDWSKPVVLVEGFFDMLHVGDNAIPLFGSTLPEDSKLFLDLVMHEPKVYVCLDSDVRNKQLAILKSLTSYGVRCYDLTVAPYKDVAEMPANVFIEKKIAARRLDRLSVLREKIHNA